MKKLLSMVAVAFTLSLVGCGGGDTKPTGPTGAAGTTPGMSGSGKMGSPSAPK